MQKIDWNTEARDLMSVVESFAAGYWTFSPNKWGNIDVQDQSTGVDVEITGLERAVDSCVGKAISDCRSRVLRAVTELNAKDSKFRLQISVNIRVKAKREDI